MFKFLYTLYKLIVMQNWKRALHNNAKNVNQILSWCVALAVSFLIANFLVFFYFYDPGWIKREGGATRGIYEPGSKIVRADEGYTITYVDENGYINQSADLVEKNYTLVLGNSQSNGNNVMPEKKWISLLNAKVQEHMKEEKVCVYNMSVGGYDFCDIVKGFKAAISEFPDSDTIIIQIMTTDLSPDNLRSSLLEQRIFTEEVRGSKLMENLTIEQTVRNYLKDLFPLLTYLSELKVPKWSVLMEGAFLHGQGEKTEITEDIIEADYKINLEQVLNYLVSEYHGKIIIINLPQVSISENGELICKEEMEETIFEGLCREKGILYCNMAEYYKNEYLDSKKIPYGFSNTELGSGHLNEDGHKMVADMLYTLWKKERD